jgi:hypothetical protein
MPAYAKDAGIRPARTDDGLRNGTLVWGLDGTRLLVKARTTRTNTEMSILNIGSVVFSNTRVRRCDVLAGL